MTRNALLARDATAGSTAVPLDAHLLATLHRMLAQAAATGSDRAVVATFIDALAVWLDLEIRAYIADVEEHYALAVTLPGSDPAAAPATLDQRPAASGGDASFVEVRGRHAAPWLLAISPDTPASSEADLRPYVEALARALDEVSSIDTSRLMWSTLQPFVRRASSAASVRQAIEHASTRLGAAMGLSVTRRDSTPVLLAGTMPVPPPIAGAKPTARLIVVPVDVPEGYTATLSLQASGPNALTMNEVRKVEAIAGICGEALAGILQPSGRGVERRSGVLSFDEAVERQAHDAAQRDAPVSIIVIVVPGAQGDGRDMRGWIGRIRETIRPTDLAGPLSASELGVVLLDTARDGARIVQERLLRLLTSGPSAHTFASASVGLASRDPGDRADSLLRLAREAAMSRS
jgi:hypothetical protein